MEAELGYTSLFIRLRETGQFIGSGGLSPVSDDIPDVEIAYHILPSEWGKGYATELPRPS
jgi:RimJ/RimL family protein N-acetyltransferase